MRVLAKLLSPFAERILLTSRQVLAMPFVLAVSFGLGVLPSNVWAQDGTVKAEPSIVSPILIGSALGLVGFVGGGYAGYLLDESCDNTSDFCIEAGLALGAALAGTAGVTIGAHLGNRRRGSLGWVSLYSLLTWAAGVGTAAALVLVSENAAAAMLVAVPVIQLGVTVVVERKTGRDNEARQRAQGPLTVFAAPDRRGIRFGARFVF